MAATPPKIMLGSAGEVDSGHGGVGVDSCPRHGAAPRRHGLARAA